MSDSQIYEADKDFFVQIHLFSMGEEISKPKRTMQFTHLKSLKSPLWKDWM